MSDKKFKILFVDDEQRILNALKAIFRREYDVYLATSGEHALKLLEKNNIDVIVSDQRMPTMLGHKLLSIVHQRYPRIMRILLTGFMDREAIIDSINEGEIFRFINKPWNPEEIRSIIAEAALASLQEPEKTLNEQPAITQQPPQAMLMMEKNREASQLIRRFCLQQNIMIYGTHNVPLAVNAVLKRPNIGVAVIELPADAQETIETLSLLKQNKPELISIVLTEQPDARVAVDLINSGQVFRYLPKPLDSEGLQKAVGQAFKRHFSLCANQSLRKRYRVSQPSRRVESRIASLFKSNINPSPA